MLRQALVSRVLVIEGIEAPASQAHVSTVACSSVQVADFTNMTPVRAIALMYRRGNPRCSALGKITLFTATKKTLPLLTNNKLVSNTWHKRKDNNKKKLATYHHSSTFFRKDTLKSSV